MTSSFHVTAIFLKNDVIFEITSQAVLILYKGLSFSELWNTSVKLVAYVTKTSYDVILVKYCPQNAQTSESDYRNPQKSGNFLLP